MSMKHGVLCLDIGDWIPKDSCTPRSTAWSFLLLPPLECGRL